MERLAKEGGKGNVEGFEGRVEFIQYLHEAELDGLKARQS